MVIASLLLAQAALTPEALVDELTARYGYGAVGSSEAGTPLQMRAITPPDDAAIRNPARATEAAIPLKKVWRVERDRTMPGVLRPLIGAYADVFSEVGPGVPRPVPTSPNSRSGFLGGSTGFSGGSWSLRIPLSRAARVSEDLARPGGVLVPATQLAELLNLPRGVLPPVYRRRSALVRIDPSWSDPSRWPSPVALLAAIVGGTTDADGKRVVFDPRAFRDLAAATLEAEAARGVRSGSATLSAKTHLSGYPTGVEAAFRAELTTWERDRPLALRLGAAAHHAAGDDELRELYGAASDPPDSLGGGTRTVAVGNFVARFPELAATWRHAGTPLREDAARVVLHAPSGLGRALPPNERGPGH